MNPRILAQLTARSTTDAPVMKRRLPLVTSFLITSIVLTGCDMMDDSSQMKAISKSTQLHRVQVVTVNDQPVELSQTIAGTLEAVTQIRLYNEEAGRINTLPYHEGDRVKKGTLLVQMDNALIKTDLEKAHASRQQAKLDLDRLKKLLPKKVSTEEEVARAQTDLDLAIADEKRQKIRVERSAITAPINGVITERNFETGDFVPAQSNITTIIDPTALRLKASVAERWITLLKPGQAVSLTIDALGDQVFQARIDRIHPTIDERTHKGIVEIVLNPVPKGARVGQFARATLDVTTSRHLTLPVHTIHYNPHGAYVFKIVKNDKGEQVARQVFFEKGQQFADVSEVISGLSAGDRIVSRGAISLRDGKKVEVIDNASSLTEPAATPDTQKPDSNQTMDSADVRTPAKESKQ
jgi:RND family efflux transporter MFP subunit